MSKPKIQPDDLIALGFEKLTSSGFEALGMNRFIFYSGKYTCSVWVTDGFLSEFYWYTKKYNNSPQERVTIDSVLENCDDNLRDIILFNLDIFKW